MKLSWLATMPLLGSIVASAEESGGGDSYNNKTPSTCLTDAETTDIVHRFAIVASEADNYTAVAQDLIDQNFQSISDSVNFVDQIPVRKVSSFQNNQSFGTPPINH
jgi:hypothetical protein